MLPRGLVNTVVYFTPSHLAVYNFRFGATELRSCFCLCPEWRHIVPRGMGAYLAIFEILLDYGILNMK